ncbi:TetR/AcrR family transcriptional regulator [Nocardioides mangrovi]|uniref:TetR/AcrR family transcriptional regulator n=1 Tax=Nocardioides mangrovi TaxID=2874580 RepID=A0ABS7UBZ7_9ACTN|nr:TetR/AcrR family transcriptional regulator [Nocardioides mangrovi]MBZ5738529.1 TetR/AcrR family transcriptional regulator [Nocardioides mangrovi]
MEDKILHAALEEYTEHGWAGFTMDAVARRAGVGKSTVYLRWHDKDSLLTDAVRLRSQQVAVVDTGTLVGDLTALASNIFHNLTSSEGWANFRVVMDSASTTEKLGQFTQEVGTVHRHVITTIFDRAAARGERTKELTPTAVTDLIYGAGLFFALGRRLEQHEPTEEEIEDRVRDVIGVILEGILVD